MNEGEKLSIVMFTGGRGTQTISATLLKYPYVTLTLVSNTYDDGLSTGRLRAFVPGMLGPSDIRKNVSRLIPDDNFAHRALHQLIEYRLPTPCAEKDAERLLRALQPGTAGVPIPEVREAFMSLSLRHARLAAEWTGHFLAYWESQKKAGLQAGRQDALFDFGDCSLGNILFVGCYLQCGGSFNKAVESFSRGCDARGRVLEVTDGQNHVLVGLKENGSYLPDEAHIVSEQEEAPIEELYLLSSYLETAQWERKPKKDLQALLAGRDQTPRINPEAESALLAADIIIYGPGTQHSSLFPSYLTQGVTEAIAANAAAEKIFIGNIRKDFEIRHETAESLVRKFFYYLNRKNTLQIPWEDLVTLFFIQDPALDDMQPSQAVTFDPARFPFPAKQVVVTNWASGPSAHSGGRVLDEVIRVVNDKTQKKLRPFRHTVSIVVPGLNEARTLRKVLRSLTLLDFSALGVGREILYVDGGSADGSLDLAQSVPEVKVFSLKDEKGRGAALRLGIQKASGDMIAFFPSDGEYEPQDLLTVIQEIVRSEFNVVYGSRLIKCVDFSQRIREIYHGNYMLYLTSKYGGILTSIMNLWMYNRFITDPFSGIKAFDARLLRNLELSSSGFEIETEILARLGQKQHYVLEVPVAYHPRTRSQGKKTTLVDGLRAIVKLMTLRAHG
ncbi:MAG: hypothetical protein A2992_01885 [Elusimicrobia bacterium RIFCSPLOWO2_01_FULL_59_12]|nr:MAG: hypothetical protein A2992_01885 [Elusimicrobia bacterium RIFCSPLOWO2_01_FULL_59_12]